MVVFTCKKCDKKYTTRSGLWKHNKLKHPPEIHECKYCLKTLSKISNLTRHYDVCKVKAEYDLYNIEMYDQAKNETFETVMNLLKNKNSIADTNDILKKLETIMENNNIHVPSNTQNVQTHQNSHNITTTTNSHNQQNSNNQQHINIVSFGTEDIVNALSTSQLKQIIKAKDNCIVDLIEKTHFNNELPEYQNILLLNKNKKLEAFTYDINKKCFIQTDKKELINELLFNNINNVYDILQEHDNDFPVKTKNYVKNIIDKLCDYQGYKAHQTFGINEKHKIVNLMIEKSGMVRSGHKKRHGKLRLKRPKTKTEIANN